MKKGLLYIIFVISFGGCVETFDVDSEIGVANSALIVEATITNELKNHQIFLSRPSDFAIVNVEDSIYDPVVRLRPIPPTIVYETNAAVNVVDNAGNTYRFSETSPGTYSSDIPFSAVQGLTYELEVTTSNGNVYRSTPEGYQVSSQIDNIAAVREFNEQGKEGVYIYIDGSSSNPEGKYFRYTYEETYKIIAPEWQKEGFVLSNYDPCALPVPTYDLELVDKDNEYGKVCYGREVSSSIIQTSTVTLGSNTVERFPIRFLNRDNYIISHRYSILVKQYAQSLNAYNFYRTLNSFSSSESVFSAVQPGVLEGNISVENNQEEKVLGFFEVSPVVESRLFFNYADLFPNQPLPDYVIGCFPTSALESHTSYCFTGEVMNSCPLSIVESVNINLIAYYGINDGTVGACPGPYTFTYRACGDCTILGAAEVPDFWTE